MLTKSVGAVSGPKGCIVMVQDALKKPWPSVPSIPIKVAEIENPVDAKSEETVTAPA